MLVPIFAAATLAALVASKPVPQAASSLDASDLLKRRACEPQPLGAGPVTKPDDVRSFARNPYYANAAENAATPEGYNVSFTNWNASNQAFGYLTYHLLDSYNTSACAAKCSEERDCLAFNVYFERDPTVEPHPVSCPNPPSTTNIKCALWSSPIYQANADNYGQWRAGFQVAIAGSNGYVKSSIATPEGYSDPTFLGDAAINALTDCDDQYTYMGVEIWTDSPFDVGRCAQACTAKSNENMSASSDGSEVQTCQFFNTYQLLKNGNVVGQYCALYSTAWPASTASNHGLTDGEDKYTIQWSYAYSNATDPGVP